MCGKVRSHEVCLTEIRAREVHANKVGPRKIGPWPDGDSVDLHKNNATGQPPTLPNGLLTDRRLETSDAELQGFVDNRMRMSHIYQPLLIRCLLLVKVDRMGLLRNLKNMGRAAALEFSSPEKAEAFRQFLARNEELADHAASTVMATNTTDGERLEAMGRYWFLVNEARDSNVSLAREQQMVMLLARCTSLGVDLDRENPFEHLPDFETGFAEAMTDFVRRFEKTGLDSPTTSPSRSSSTNKPPSRSSAASKAGRIRMRHHTTGN